MTKNFFLPFIFVSIKNCITSLVETDADESVYDHLMLRPAAKGEVIVIDLHNLTHAGLATF